MVVTRLKELCMNSIQLKPIQQNCDIKAINIILQGLPTEIYALVSQHRVAKDLWEKIKLLMQGTSLTKQERECKLYDEFDKFTYKKGETLHDKFVTDVKLVKDLHTTNVDQLHAHLQQHERHAIEVRLMHERNPDPLALVASHQLTQPAYQSHLHPHQQSLSQHHVSPYQSSQIVSPYQTQQFTTNQSTPLSLTYPTNEYQPTVHHNVYSQQPSIPQLEYAPTTYQQQQPEFTQPDSSLVVPVFQKGDDPIDAINHMMSFLTAVVTSRYPTTNNQLRTSSNPRQQATIYDGKVTVQPVQGRQTSYAAGTTRKYTPGASGSNTGRQRTVICYNCKGEGHIAKQCTKPKRKRDETWFNDKVLLVQAQAGGQFHNSRKEKAFIWQYPGLPDIQTTQDTRLLSCNLSRNGSDALTEVHNQDNLNYDLFNQSEQIMTSSEQSNDVSQSETDITSDSNIIPYSQYLSETQQETVQNSNSSAHQDVLILSMFEQITTQVTHCNTVNKALTTELDRYKEEVKDLKEKQNVENSFSGSNEQFAEIVHLKQNLFEQVQEKDCLIKTVSELKNKLKFEENRNIEREIELEKKIKQLDNIIFKRGQSAQTVRMLTKSKICYDHSSKQAIGFEKPFCMKKARESKPKLYDGNTILKMDTIVVPDSDETLELSEKSRSKMLLKEQDPLFVKHKINTKPINYDILNNDYYKRFVRQTDLYCEHAYWKATSVPALDPSHSSTTVIVEVPKELPTVSMVNTSLKELKRYLTGFDQVVKERTTATAITEGTWGFEHTKACFRDEIIPFIKNLKDIFNNFNRYLVEELADVQKVFYQMEQAVEQHRLESRTFEVKMNQVLGENERLLEQAINKDIVKTVVNLSMNANGENVTECQKCLELETELVKKKDFVDKETYDKLCKCFTNLEKHCITLEADSQLNQEIFQQENSVLNQNAPSFSQLFELSELKAQSQAKDTVIVKLKEHIKSLKGNGEDSSVKLDMDEIETLNIELEHRVTKLVTENEHLKQTYKQLYDSIKPKRVQSKEQCDALIKQVNIKSAEISDLNAKLQEQGLVIAALKNELRKLKGKALDNKETVTHSVDPNMDKDNMEPITPKLLNKRTAHSSYIKHTQEEALVLRDIVEHVKANYPQDPLLESAFRYTKVIQDLLSHISRSCPSINNCGPQVIEVIPRKKDKKVRFAESLTSIENTKSASTSNVVSNKRVLHSTGVRLSTSASGSQPSGNTKNDRILQPPSSNSKNKVEAHPRNVKTSLNKKNGAVHVKGSAVVQNLKKQDNSDSVCVNRNDVPFNRITTTNEEPSGNQLVQDSKSPKPVGCPSCPLVFGLRLLEAHDRRSLSAHQFLNKFGYSPNSGNDQVAKDNAVLEIIRLWNVYYFKDLSGPMRVASVNGKKYILIIMIQVRLKETIRRIRTDNGTEFVNQTLAVNIRERLGLVPNPPSSTPFVPPSRSDWDLLFQPMFDESLNPPPYVDLQAPEGIAPIQ
ncbi:retrovirus-related pol polyprotein from transposon TNT 1-94 [Tanacetum coccineum]